MHIYNDIIEYNTKLLVFKKEQEELKEEVLKPESQILNEFIKLNVQRESLQRRIKNYRKTGKLSDIENLAKELNDIKKTMTKIIKDNPGIEQKSHELKTRVQNCYLKHARLKDEQELLQKLCGVKRPSFSVSELHRKQDENKRAKLE